MNSMQRRLFRAFAEAGGDLTEDVDVERFIRYIDATLILLPPRVREATELVWRCQDGLSYSLLVTELTQRFGNAVSVSTLRQRVSRGARELEAAIRRRSWGDAPPTVKAGGVLTAHGGDLSSLRPRP
jgi:hypothetical protein